MAADNFAPYAPLKPVMAVINRYRDRGLPDPLPVAALEQIGIAPSMSSRTHQALRFLGLLDEGGNRMEAFERLKRATSDEYPEQLAEIVRAAYLPIFTIVDPAADNDMAILDAFRRYEPSAQRDKMIALFRGLCVEAEIIDGTTIVRAPRSAPAAKPAKKPVSKLETNKPATRHETPPAGNRDEDGGMDLRLVSAIIQQLPKDGRWTEQRRERWIAAMTSAVDLVVEVVDA